MKFHSKVIGEDRILLCYGDRYCYVHIEEHILKEQPNVLIYRLQDMFLRMVHDINRNDLNNHLLRMFQMECDNAYTHKDYTISKAGRRLLEALNDT